MFFPRQCVHILRGRSSVFSTSRLCFRLVPPLSRHVSRIFLVHVFLHSSFSHDVCSCLEASKSVTKEWIYRVLVIAWIMTLGSVDEPGRNVIRAIIVTGNYEFSLHSIYCHARVARPWKVRRMTKYLMGTSEKSLTSACAGGTIVNILCFTNSMVTQLARVTARTRIWHRERRWSYGSASKWYS